MSTSKKPVTFYPSAEVAAWLENFDSGERSRQINEAIKASALKPKALFEIPLGFYQMSDLLEILKEEETRRDETVENVVDEEDIGKAQEWASKASSLRSHFEKFVR